MKTNDLSPLNQHLAVRVRLYRAQMQMTLKELDQALSLPPGTVSRIERGDKRLDCLTLHKFSEFLNIPIDAFFEDMPETGLSAPDVPRSGVAVSEIEDLLETYTQIQTPQVRREFLTLLRSISDSPAYSVPLPVGADDD